jgi:hypothetical protein
VEKLQTYFWNIKPCFFGNTYVILDPHLSGIGGTDLRHLENDGMSLGRFMLQRFGYAMFVM